MTPQQASAEQAIFLISLGTPATITPDIWNEFMGSLASHEYIDNKNHLTKKETDMFGNLTEMVFRKTFKTFAFIINEGRTDRLYHFKPNQVMSIDIRAYSKTKKE